MINESKDKLFELINNGRLPISTTNIEILELEENGSFFSVVNERSESADLTIIGMNDDQPEIEKKFISGFTNLGDVLFVNASQLREIR
jgi:hypothetical protein